MNFLKRHPFEVEAYFENSTVLTFAIPKEDLQHLIPECLELDTFRDEWGFIAIALVQTDNLRPKGFPVFFGSSFFLIGYRIFVRFVTNEGKSLRGLYILKSETDKKKMEYLGNIFTKYNYTTTDITQNIENSNRIISSKKSKFKIVIDQHLNDVNIPSSSPFTDWKEARRFAGPLPFTFSYNEKEKTVLIIQGVRQNWKPKPIKILEYNFDFLNKQKFSTILLGSAFEINNVPYYWKKGIEESWG